MLITVGALAGYDDHRWAGFQQIKAAGGHVRRGEHGHWICIMRSCGGGGRQQDSAETDLARNKPARTRTIPQPERGRGSTRTPRSGRCGTQRSARASRRSRTVRSLAYIYRGTWRPTTHIHDHRADRDPREPPGCRHRGRLRDALRLGWTTRPETAWGRTGPTTSSTSRWARHRIGIGTGRAQARPRRPCPGLTGPSRPRSQSPPLSRPKPQLYTRPEVEPAAAPVAVTCRRGELRHHAGAEPPDRERGQEAHRPLNAETPKPGRDHAGDLNRLTLRTSTSSRSRERRAANGRPGPGRARRRDPDPVTGPVRARQQRLTR